MRKKIWAGLILLYCTNGFTAALGTLPQGINSPSLRMGRVEGIGERYNGQGSLLAIGDYKSVVFNAENLMRMNTRAQDLINALNKFGTQDLGSKINFGVFKVETKPEIQYTAPVWAKGLSDQWTLALAVPVVHYSNQIRMVSENSNLSLYRNQLAGVNAELDKALNIDLGQETQNTLRARGYRELDNRDETFIGDLQLVSLFNFWKNMDSVLQYSASLSLPTGPKFNSDDLAALNIFGRTSLENKISFARSFSHFDVIPYISVLYVLPDHVTARVPLDESDVIPDQNSKEFVARRIGPTATLGNEFSYSMNDEYTLNAGYAISKKSPDEYAGDQSRRYDLLGQNTNSAFSKVNLGISYSTVSAFFKKRSAVPTVIAFNFSDTISGRNVERQTTQELNLMMFF